LQVIGNMKGPDGKPMIDPETMTDIAGKGLGAQQKFLGMAMPSIMQQQQLQNQNTAQQRMLQMYQQNPGLLGTKIGTEATPATRPPANYYQQPQQTTPQSPQQNPAPAQTRNAPKFSAPPGYQWTQGAHPNNPDIQLHFLHDPSGAIVQAYNPDGSPLGQ